MTYTNKASPTSKLIMKNSIYASQLGPIVKALTRRVAFGSALALRKSFLAAAEPTHYFLSLSLAASSLILVFAALIQCLSFPALNLPESSIALFAALALAFALVDGWRNRAFFAKCPPLSFRRPFGSLMAFLGLGTFVWAGRLDLMGSSFNGTPPASPPSFPTPLFFSETLFRPSTFFAASQKAATWRDCWTPLKFSPLAVPCYAAVLAQTALGLLWASASALAMAALLPLALIERGLFALASIAQSPPPSGASADWASRTRSAVESWLSGVAAEAAADIATREVRQMQGSVSTKNTKPPPRL